jgi:hypothetical protein
MKSTIKIELRLGFYRFFLFEFKILAFSFQKSAIFKMK